MNNTLLAVAAIPIITRATTPANIFIPNKLPHTLTTSASSTEEKRLWRSEGRISKKNPGEVREGFPWCQS